MEGLRKDLDEERELRRSAVIESDKLWNEYRSEAHQALTAKAGLEKEVAFLSESLATLEASLCPVVLALADSMEAAGQACAMRAEDDRARARADVVKEQAVVERTQRGAMLAQVERDLLHRLEEDVSGLAVALERVQAAADVGSRETQRALAEHAGRAAAEEAKRVEGEQLKARVERGLEGLSFAVSEWAVELRAAQVDAAAEQLRAQRQARARERERIFAEAMSVVAQQQKAEVDSLQSVLDSTELSRGLGLLLNDYERGEWADTAISRARELASSFSERGAASSRSSSSPPPPPPPPPPPSNAVGAPAFRRSSKASAADDEGRDDHAGVLASGASTKFDANGAADLPEGATDSEAARWLEVQQERARLLDEVEQLQQQQGLLQASHAEAEAELRREHALLEEELRIVIEEEKRVRQTREEEWKGQKRQMEEELRRVTASAEEVEQEQMERQLEMERLSRRERELEEQILMHVQQPPSGDGGKAELEHQVHRMSAELDALLSRLASMELEAEAERDRAASLEELVRQREDDLDSLNRTIALYAECLAQDAAGVALLEESSPGSSPSQAPSPSAVTPATAGRGGGAEEQPAGAESSKVALLRGDTRAHAARASGGGQGGLGTGEEAGEERGEPCKAGMENLVMLQSTCDRLRSKTISLRADNKRLRRRVAQLEREVEAEEHSTSHGGVKRDEGADAQAASAGVGKVAAANNLVEERSALVMATLHGQCTKARLEAEALRRENRRLLCSPELLPEDFARNRLAAELKAAQDSLSRSIKRSDVLRRKVESALVRWRACGLVREAWECWAQEALTQPVGQGARAQPPQAPPAGRGPYSASSSYGSDDSAPGSPSRSPTPPTPPLPAHALSDAGAAASRGDSPAGSGHSAFESRGDGGVDGGGGEEEEAMDGESLPPPPPPAPARYVL